MISRTRAAWSQTAGGDVVVAPPLERSATRHEVELRQRWQTGTAVASPEAEHLGGGVYSSYPSPTARRRAGLAIILGGPGVEHPAAVIVITTFDTDE